MTDDQAKTVILPGPRATVASQSSAEFIFNQIKYHKFAVLAVLLIIVLAGTGLAFYLRARSANSVIDPIAVEVRVDPIWDFLHSDPRFTDLLRRIGYKV